MNAKTYNRYEMIIRQFMSVEEPTEDLLARFHGWLLNGRHYREKNLVIRRLFFEALSDESASAQEHSDGDSASQNEFLKNCRRCCPVSNPNRQMKQV